MSADVKAYQAQVTLARGSVARRPNRLRADDPMQLSRSSLELICDQNDKRMSACRPSIRLGRYDQTM